MNSYFIYTSILLFILNVLSFSKCKDKTIKENHISQEVSPITIGHLHESALDRRLGGLAIFTRFVMWEIDDKTSPTFLEKAFQEGYLGVFFHFSALLNKDVIDVLNRYISQLRFIVKLPFPPNGTSEKILFKQIEEIAQNLHINQLPQGKILYLMLEAQPGEDSPEDWKIAISSFADSLYGTGKILYLGLYATSNLNLKDYHFLLDAEKLWGVTLPHIFVEIQDNEPVLREWKNKGIGIITYDVHSAFRQLVKQPEHGYTLKASAFRFSARHSFGIITLSPLKNKTDLDIVLASAKKKVTTLGQ